MPTLDHAEILSKLKNTQFGNHKKIIIDTDAYNSIDDQFALVHM